MAIGQELGSEEQAAEGEWLLARVQWACGDLEAASGRMDDLQLRLKNPRIKRQVQAWQARLAVEAGNRDAVSRWLEGLESSANYLPVIYQEQAGLIRARAWIALGRADEALEMLKRAIAPALEQKRKTSQIEMLNLIARAEASKGRKEPSMQALAQALRVGPPEHYQRVYLNEGAGLRWVLEALAAQQDHPAEAQAAQAILAASESPGLGKPHGGRVGTGGSQAAVLNGEPLSQQEERVMRLLAAGLSNPEIADELVLSVNTVKTHVKSVYRKLNVNKRSAVRDMARRGR
jgi:LuxR family maltose regulon positive regulatory protein